MEENRCKGCRARDAITTRLAKRIDELEAAIKILRRLRNEN